MSERNAGSRTPSHDQIWTSFEKSLEAHALENI